MSSPFGYTSREWDPSEARRQAWPFYIVCDVSESMWSEKTWKSVDSPHTIMNQSLSLMLETLADHPLAKKIAHLGILVFAADAETHYELAPFERGGIGLLPKGTKSGTWTNYVAVWKHLNDVVRQDIDRLQEEEYSLKEPVVFFLTDGNAGAVDIKQPIEKWKPYRDTLCDRSYPYRPRVIALGMGNVNRETVLAIRSDDPPGGAYRADPGQPASLLLDGIMRFIITSIKDSTTQGRFNFKTPPGMTRLDEE